LVFGRSPRAYNWPMGLRGSVRARFVIATILFGVLLGCASQPSPTLPQAASPLAEPSAATTPTLSPYPYPVPTPNGPFPATVLGMPVVSVAEAGRLLADGTLDGREVAVGGYFSEAAPPCPQPDGYFGPLEDPCHFVGFADNIDGARLCISMAAPGLPCQSTGTGPVDPWLFSATSGGDSGLVEVDQGPIAVVFVGHVADSRQFQCLALRGREVPISQWKRPGRASFPLTASHTRR
jgi:hypothetical protein